MRTRNLLYSLLLIVPLVVAQPGGILSKADVGALLGSKALRVRTGDFIGAWGLAYEPSDAEKTELGKAGVSAAQLRRDKDLTREPLTRVEVEEMLHSQEVRHLAAPSMAMFRIAFDLSDSAEQDVLKAGLDPADLDRLWTRFRARTLGTLRSLNTAAITYASTYGGFAPSITNFGPPPKGKSLSPETADLLADWVVSGRPGIGYVFTYTAGPKGASGSIDSYTISVRPTAWKPGRPSYFSDQSAVIRSTNENRAATAKDEPI